jgi:hypothetical protein
LLSIRSRSCNRKWFRIRTSFDFKSTWWRTNDTITFNKLIKLKDFVRIFICFLDEDDEDDDTDDAFSKRQGGLNKVDKQSECEIKCIYKQRNPSSGKGKTVKEAAKVCKNLCPASAKKRGDKKNVVQRKTEHHNKINTREFVDDDSNSSDEQETQRREFYAYLMEQLQSNNDE